MKSLLYIDDIAERLGITANAVRLRVHRRCASIPKPLPKERKAGKLAWRVSDFNKWIDQLDRAIRRPLARVTAQSVKRKSMI